MIGLLGLGGCVGGGTKTPEDRYYSFPEPTPTLKLKRVILKGTLGISRLEADGTRSDRSILYIEVDNPYEIKKYHYRHWTDAPTGLVQQRIYTYLRDINFAKDVTRFTPGVTVNYILRGRLKAFERVIGGSSDKVKVSLELYVTNARTGETVIPSREYSVEIEIGSTSTKDAAMNKSVVAFERAVRWNLDRFIADNAPKKSKFAKTVKARKKP
jgi:ABC-type uncharacterized transport system auxiliary subunit